MAMQSEIINLIRNTIFGWEGKVVRPNAFLQEFQTAYCYTTSGPFTGRISRNGPTWASCCHLGTQGFALWETVGAVRWLYGDVPQTESDHGSHRPPEERWHGSR